MVAYESLTVDQKAVVECEAPVVLVLGGAGVGKTTTALWAARQHLRGDPRFGRLNASRRVLFVTFSRTAVAQVQSRSAGVVKGLGDYIEVSTFHGLCYRVLRSFGRYAGLPTDPTLQGAARSRLLGGPTTNAVLTYAHLLPKTLELLRKGGPISDTLRSHWSLVVCDEFQDTGNDEWELLTLLMPNARLLLLADPNQMIFGHLPGVSDARLDTARVVECCFEITLPLESHRDPSQVLPAAASEIRWRRFDSDEVANAVASGRLVIRANAPDEDDARAQVIALELDRMRETGHESFGIFTKTNNDAVGLSGALSAAGVSHIPIGFSESYGESLGALMAIVDYAVGDASWEAARTALAVAITASDRTFKNQAPPLAQAIHAGRTVSPAFDRLLDDFRRSLDAVGGDLMAAVDRAMLTWSALALSFGARAWRRAAAAFRTMAELDQTRGPGSQDRLRLQVEVAQTASFVDLDGGDADRTQLMNFSQTKGREADGVILNFGSGDYFGTGGEPFDEPSRLLYVALTRARRTAVVLLPSDPHPLVAPFLRYA